MTNAAKVRRNLGAAITMRSAETELQNTIELRATASEIVALYGTRRRMARERRRAKSSVASMETLNYKTIY